MVVAFMPLVFIPGEGTELYRGVGVVVLTGLLFATLVAIGPLVRRPGNIVQPQSGFGLPDFPG